jgi:hypothetical protein
MALVGERKALAAAGAAFFTVIYAMNGLVGPPGMTTMFLALAAVYGVAFFGVVAGWFWARWYAVGIGFSGLVISAIAAFQIGLDPLLLIIAVPHAGMVLGLVGRGMVPAYEGRPEWRERWRMDENGVHRLGKAVMRAGASLPYLVMAGLAPKGAALPAIAGVAAVGLGALGLRALVQNRAWGLFALAGAAGACVVVVAAAAGPVVLSAGTGVAAGTAGLAALVLLVAAVAPFGRPLLRALRA